MVMGEPKRSIMEGIENTGDVRLHDHRLRLKQRFDIIRKLGQGTYGKVQLGINKKTGQEVAIKTIKKCKIETEADLVRIRREVQIMSSVRHPNIVHIYEVFENSEKMILVMEYCAGGELYDYLSQQKVLQEDEARRLFRQISTAVYYCHKHKICHRDLKLENVLLDEHGSAKIADFGLSNVFEERRLLSTFCGSPLYASPEIVKGTPYIGPEVDCWSLGVLLYTLVYGAMPFDGSNFKRLVKQISTGDYFEPKSPSTASPLIRDMLTVDPIQRADITHICDHLWVNKGSDVSCLDLAEALANETPVRLDLLLSLAPPPTIGSDKLVVTDEVVGPDGSPSRSMSLGNVDNSAERRILEMVAEGGTDAIKPSPTRTIVSNEQPKRKLETTVSMDSAPSQRKKERVLSSGSRQNVNQIEPEITFPPAENNGENKSIQEDTVVIQEQFDNAVVPEVPIPMNQSETIIGDVPKSNIIKQPSLIVQNEVKQNESPTKVIRVPSPEKNCINAQQDKENRAEPKIKDPIVKEKNVTPKQSIVKKKVATIAKKEEKPKVESVQEKSPPRKSIEKDIIVKTQADKKTDEASTNEASPPKQTPERRRSRILDTAEKLNNLSIQSAPTENIPSPPKPKKVIIPGVSVGSFKEQFERRASLTGSIPVPSSDLRKKSDASNNKTPTSSVSVSPTKQTTVPSEKPLKQSPPTAVPVDIVPKKESASVKLENIGVEPPLQPKEQSSKVPLEVKKPAIIEVNKVPKILHKSESLREPSKHNPLNNNLSLEDARRSLQQSMALLSQAKSEVKTEPVDDYQTERQKQLKTAREIISNAIGEDGKKTHRICMGAKPPVPYGSGGRSSSGTISLSSLPSSPPMSPPHPKPIVRESPARTFRTEVQHRVDDVRNKFFPNSRGNSVERIIPIQFADEPPRISNPSPPVSSTQLPYQRNNTMPFRLGSLPRGCSSDYESEQTPQPSIPPTPINVSKAEPIKKSPREFIIPIAVEGKGFVTPRQGSLEPSDTPNKLASSNIGFPSRFPKPRRISSLVSGGESEDEDDMHMHRLRSSRRIRADAEKDSISSGEEDDDEGFELLTAENLFSTLLDRVRSLTNRLNGEEGTGFASPHQTLFNNLHSPFFNSPHLPRTHKRHNVMRDGPSWRRSTSRDMASDFDSMFPSHTTFPRGSKKSRKAASTTTNSTKTTKADHQSNTEQHHPITTASDNQEFLDLSDLDLSKIELSEKDMETLSGLTPALSRRLQKQLLDHLPPAAARSLRRTLSLNSQNNSDKTNQQKYIRSLSASKTNNISHLEEDEKVSSDLLNNTKQRYSSIEDDDTSSVSYCSTLSKDYNNIEQNLNKEIDKGELTKLNSGKSTPDRSVLSKYLSPEKEISDYYGISRRYSPRISSVDATPRRRVSRFLRPDFFDTPREESIYVRDKLDKESETQQILKEIRERRQHYRAVSPISPSSDSLPYFDTVNSKINSKAVLSPNRSRSGTPFYPILDNINEIHGDFNLNNKENSPCRYVKSEESLESDLPNLNIAESESQQQQRPKSFPHKDNSISSFKENSAESKKVSEKESRIVRPKSYPATTPSPEKILRNIPNNKVDNSNTNDNDVSVTFNVNLPSKNIKAVKEIDQTNDENKKSPAKKKVIVKKKSSQKLATKSMSSEKETDDKKDTPSKKISVLKSIGQKIEKFRNDSFIRGPSQEKEIVNKKQKSPSASKEEKVQSAFSANVCKRSMREHSVPINSAPPTTESGLIKRAVTITNLPVMDSKENKKNVIKVFGLFNKKVEQKENEDNPTQSNILTVDKPKRPTSLLLNGLGKKMQSCYNGSLAAANPDNLNAEKSDENKPTKKALKLDFSRLPKLNQNIFNKRNSVDECNDLNGNTDNSSSITNGNVTPNAEIVSFSPDYNSNKSLPDHPESNEYFHKDHEDSENIIDRIRRKSFYSRFNEKKNRRKSTLVGPGAKEYIPSTRINPQCESDDVHYSTVTPTSPLKYNAIGFDHSSSRLEKPVRSVYSTNDHYFDGIDSPSFSISRYPRTLSYFDDYDMRSLENKNPNTRYGRTLSLLSPGIYATYSPRSHTRNSAILLRDTVDVDVSPEDILTKIRNRKRAAAAQNMNGDEGHHGTLENISRSNHIHDSEHDTSANNLE